MRFPYALALLATLLAHVSLAFDPVQEGGTFDVPEFELTLDLSGLEKLEGGLHTRGQQRGQWSAEYNGTRITFSLAALTVKEGFDFSSPSEIAMIVGNNRGNALRKKGGSYEYQISKPIEGSFGFVPYGWLAAHDTYTGTKKDGYDIVLGGVTKAGAWFLDMNLQGRLKDKDWTKFEEWAAGVPTYSGPIMDPEWTEEEEEARWERSMPDSVEGNSNNQVIRTKYYIIFTNVGKSTVRAFAKQVDENYEKVRSVYPFEDLPGQRLLPIFYFVNNTEYYDWCEKNISWTRKQAAQSGGVASGDAYSTYHQAIKASVHIHEQTHQIFKNRLHLGGGGSWFQEGVAEYISVQPTEINEVKQLAKKGRTKPLAELMVVPSLLMSADGAQQKTGGSVAGSAYAQAASVVEFVKHSKFGKDRFLEWIHAMGSVGRGDLPAIKRGITEVYGVTLEEFEEAYVEYWAKRKKPKGWHGPSKKGKKKKR
ncbi:MAG: hypothetical protein AAGG01_18090 [Planctomycetota bacterium]